MGLRCTMLPSIGRSGKASPCFGKEKGLLHEVLQLTALTARYITKALITQTCGDQTISYFLNSELKDYFFFFSYGEQLVRIVIIWGSNCCYAEEPCTCLGLGEKPKALPGSRKDIFLPQ